MAELGHEPPVSIDKEDRSPERPSAAPRTVGKRAGAGGITGAIRRNRAYGYVLALMVFVLDQATKWVVTYPLELQKYRVIDVTDFFALNWVENRGVSMGFLTASDELTRWLLVAMTSAIALFVAIWLWREKRRDDAWGLALVLGGALGNIVDRIRYGYVVDFLDLHFGEWRPFLVFNVADAAITVGVLLLLLRALLTRKPKPTKQQG
jgi:signal peptidase II